MADIVDSATRSRMMSRVRGRDTLPELLVRRYLHAAGLRFRTNVRKLPGSPDIVLPRYRTVVFIHGCFWHRHAGCRFAATPATRTEFWNGKFSANVSRDLRVRGELEALGWNVLTVWECQLASELGLDEIFWKIVGGWTPPASDISPG